MRRRYLLYRGFFLACFLSIVFSLVVFWARGVNFKTILLSVLTFNLNVAFILLITIVIITIPIKMKRRIFLFSLMNVLFIFIYSLNFYLFLTKGEGIRLQVLLFIYKLTPIFIFLGGLAVIAIVLLITTVVSSKLIQRKIEKVDANIEKMTPVAKKIGREIEKASHGAEKDIKNFEKMSRSKVWMAVAIIGFLILLLIIIFSSAQLLKMNEANVNPFLIRWGSSFYTFDRNIDFGERDLGEKVLDFKINKSDQNVVFVLMDTVPYYKLNYYGYNRTVSPNIDKLAEDSVVFWNAFSTSSHSDYSQTALFSSRHTLVNNQQNFFEDYPRKFAWDVFKGEGYSTAHISSQDDSWAYINYYWNTDNLDLYHDSMADLKYDYGSGKARKDFDDRTVDYAIEWLNESVDDEPFFLSVTLQSTHNPYKIPDGNEIYMDKWINGLPRTLQDPSVVITHYDNALLFMDKQIGRLIDVLKERDGLNNTIIIITSDHGENLEGMHGEYTHGMSIYNEETRVPLIMYIPGVEHRDIYDNVAQIDFFPTLFDLMGYLIPDEFQGKIMRKKNFIISYIQTFRYHIGLIDDDMKIILDMHDEKIEIYNLTEDPEELDNLVNSVDYSVLFAEVMTWYLCQIEYYSDELWKEGELVPKC